MTTFKGNIPVKNIFYMFYYAIQDSGTVELPQLPNLGSVSTEDFHDLRDLFAAMLGETLGKQLKQGLFREYLDIVEDIPTVRGKINITGTIRNKISQRQLLTCEHDELSENTLSNRILKTTAMLLLRDKDVKEVRKKDLRKEMRYFSNVNEIDPALIRWSLVRYHRNNQGYRLLIFICRVILQELLLTSPEEGGYVLRAFPSEADEKRFMADIYERFIRGYYTRHSPDLKPGRPKIKWDIVDDEYRDDALPEMRSDIVLTHDKEVLIIDAKWSKKPLTIRNFDKGEKEEEEEEVSSNKGKGRIYSAYLYQIFTYVKNTDATENVGRTLDNKVPVSGMLLYARTHGIEEGKPVIGGPYNMGGNWIHVRALDLSKDFDGVKKQLDGFAEEFKNGEFSAPPPRQFQTS